MRRNSLIMGRIRWAALAAALMSIASMFIATTTAQAVVVNVSGTTAGVAMVPGTRSTLPAGAVVVPGGTCSDPWLTSDLVYRASANPLCYRSGSVIHRDA